MIQIVSASRMPALSSRPPGMPTAFMDPPPRLPRALKPRPLPWLGTACSGRCRTTLSRRALRAWIAHDLRSWCVKTIELPSGKVEGLVRVCLLEMVQLGDTPDHMTSRSACKAPVRLIDCRMTTRSLGETPMALSAETRSPILVPVGSITSF